MNVNTLKSALPEGATIEEDCYGHQKTITVCAPEGKVWAANENGTLLSSYYLPSSSCCNRASSIKALLSGVKEGLITL